MSRILTESGLGFIRGRIYGGLLARSGQTRSSIHKRLAGKVTTLYGLHDDVRTLSCNLTYGYIRNLLCKCTYFRRGQVALGHLPTLRGQTMVGKVRPGPDESFGVGFNDASATKAILGRLVSFSAF